MFKGKDRGSVIAHDGLNDQGRLIAAAKPDNLWRRAEKRSHFREVRIERHDRISISSGAV